MLYDEYTGELLDEGLGILTGGSGRYLQPLDVSEVKNAEMFKEAVSKTVGKRKFKLWVSPFILDIIVDRQLTSPALGLFCFLGQNISYHTLVYMSTKDISTGSGYVRQTVSSAITELMDKYLIRKMPNVLEDKGDRFLMLNPLYFYLGYYPNRENVLKKWVEGVT